MTGDPERLVAAAVTIARAAGSAIMEIYARANHGAVMKEDASPLTLADRAAHEYITSRLAELTPAIPIISEESETPAFEHRRKWRRFWMIDPLDGTKEFLSRNGEFTVNIALIEDGVPVAGVVYAPVLDACFYAAAGGDATRVDARGSKRLRCSDYRRSGLRVVASRSHAGPDVPRLLSRIGDPPCLSKGSSLKFCLIAEGTANFYPRLGTTMEWDVAAAHCIVSAAGGSITDTLGSDLRYNKADLRNPHLIACGNPPYPWQAAFAELETG